VKRPAIVPSPRALPPATQLLATMADAGARGKRPRTNVHDWYDSCVTSTSYVRCPVCVEEREAGTRHAGDVHSGRKDNLIASNGHISRKHGPSQLDQYKSWKDIADDPAVRNITSFFLPSATGRQQGRVLLRRALLRNPARAPLLHPRRSLAYSTRALRLCSGQRSTAVEGSFSAAYIHWNGPLLHRGDSFLAASVNTHFKGNGPRDWNFMNRTQRADKLKFRHVSKVVDRGPRAIRAE